MQVLKEETSCFHSMDYTLLLIARDILYAPSHRQDNTYHDFCYTICGSLVEMGKSLKIIPLRRFDPVTKTLQSSILSAELNPALTNIRISVG